MREPNRSMAFTDCMKPAEPSAHMMQKNWRNRIGFFLKTNSSQSRLKLLKNKTDRRPTADDVHQWAQSLDKLLAHKYGKAAFYVFLKSEFCEENVEFWTACEAYRTITSPKQLASKANSMYEEFIQREAPKEINLDFHTKNTIYESLHEPSATSFLAAQKKVYSLMENNSYPRFIHSDLYKQMSEAAHG